MAINAGPDIIEDGLVLCLDAGNRRSYPGSGSTWTDLSGRGNNLTLTNGPAYSTTNGGNLSFDGTTQYASTTSSSLNLSDGDFAIDLWFYYPDSQVGYYRKLMGTGTYLQPGYMIIINDTTTIPLFGIQYGTTTWNGVGSGTPRKNSWNNGIVTRTNGVFNVYLNNEFVGSNVDSYNLANSTNSFVIGANGGFGEHFAGNVAVVKQYSRGLNVNDVSQNFNALRGRFGL